MTHGRRDGRDHPVQFRFTERLVARQMEQMQTVVKGGRTCGGGDAVPAPDRHAKTLEPAEIRIRLLDVEDRKSTYRARSHPADVETMADSVECRRMRLPSAGSSRACAGQLRWYWRGDRPAWKSVATPALLR